MVVPLLDDSLTYSMLVGQRLETKNMIVKASLTSSNIKPTQKKAVKIDMVVQV
jgi:hypothetical protein